MSAERVDVLNLSQVNLHESPSSHSLLFRLKQTLISCSKSIEAEDFRQSEESISKITELLNSVSDAVVSEPENKAVENEAIAVLTEIHQYITEPSLDQAVIDALSFELPKAVARFASASEGCVEIAESVIDHFIGTCSPRDMIAVLCEALGSPSKMFKTHGYFDPLLSGLTKVFVAIQRRHFEQIKAAVPVVLNVLTTMSLDSNDADGDENSKDLFDRSIGIANSIQAVCVKLDDKVNKKLRALLGLFVLQIMALVSISLRDEISSCLPLVKQLSHILRSCNLSYLGLITGYEIDTLTSTVLGDDEDDYMSCFSHVKHGASLAVVIWGHMSNEVAQAAEDDLASVKDELCRDQTKRWQAIKMLKHILSWVELRWDLKSHAIIFLLYILNGNVPHKYISAHVDDSAHMLGLFASLQAIEMVIIYAPDAALRKNAFDALKRVLVDIPSSQRFDILLALIKNSDSSSMIAILIGRLKEEMHIANCQKISVGNDEVPQAKDEASFALFWSAGVLELVKSVLRPPQGGPPSLPEYGDAVLSTLNLYRFVLITESKGKTNYTGVLSRNNLEKAYNEWFLPLRTLVSGIVAETRKDCDEFAYDTVCAINPIELVLYRCIELVEEKLKHST